MDFSLNDDQLALQAAAQAFAAGELAPHAARWDEESIFPKDTLRQAGEMGFCGIYTPETYGGLGLSRLDASIIFEALSGGCTSTTAYLTIHNMATWMIASWAQADVAERWVPGMVAGELLGSYCLTEPGNGSDAAALKTSAILDGDGYRLNGSKMFISGGGDSDVLVVMARTGGPGAKGVSAFVVAADSPGISYGRKESKMGWNSQPTRAITFEDVHVPANQRLGEEGEGFRIAMKGLDGGRLNIASCSVGTAQAALDAACSYVKGRQQFGQAIMDFQITQFKLADMLTELIAARQMVRLAACKLDAADVDATAYCAMAKRFATDMGFRVCNEALQLLGGYGYIREYPLERMVRDTRVHQILEGSNEIMRVIVGRALQDEAVLARLR